MLPWFSHFSCYEVLKLIQFTAQQEFSLNEDDDDNIKNKQRTRATSTSAAVFHSWKRLWKGQRFGHWEKGFPANQSLKQQRNMRTGIDLTEKRDRRKWENKLLTMIITLENMAGRNREDFENDVSLELQCLKPPAHFCLIKRHFVSNTSSLKVLLISFSPARVRH